MHFVVHCLDAPGVLDRRTAARAEHSARLRQPSPVTLLFYGPLVERGADDADPVPVGSMFVVEAASLDVVADYFAADPFRTRGVWEAVRIHELVVSANSPVRLDVPVAEGSAP